MTHSINLTHDGTLILRIPKGYKVEKVVVEEMGTGNRVECQPTHPTPSNTLGALDCVERQAAIEVASRECHEFRGIFADIEKGLNQLPSVQLDRDIPMKPIETTDRAWGIPKKQAVCPKCDYYLGNVYFLGDYKGKRITYCETCGQAIDWEGWDFDD